MCMVDDCDEFVTVLSARHDRARKPHKCTECCRQIEPGEWYLREATIVGKDFTVYKTCTHCEIVRQWLRDECGGWVYTAIEEDIREHADDGHYGFAVKKLAIGMSRRWKRRDGKIWPIPSLPKTSASAVVES